MRLIKERWATNYPKADLIEVSSPRNFNIEDLVTLIFLNLIKVRFIFHFPKTIKLISPSILVKSYGKKIIVLTEEEVPFSVAVVTDKVSEPN